MIRILLTICTAASLLASSAPASAQWPVTSNSAAQQQGASLHGEGRLTDPAKLRHAPAAPRSPTTAASIRTLGWPDLLPRLESPEAPFSNLPPALREAMRVHVRWVTASRRSQEDPGFAKEHKAAEEQLASNAIDVEDLMERRRQIILSNNRGAKAANGDVVGKQVRIPGYVIPLVFDGRKVVEFLLVPTAGACVHTPTPPKNQVVHVRYPAGYAFRSIFEAIWVEGRLQAQEIESNVTFSDGTADVEAIYTLKAASVESYLS